MAYGTVNADVIGTSVANTSLGAGNASIMKNRIINGAMVIDQRNAGSSINIVGGSFPVDRFVFNTTQDNKGTSQQSSTAPIGFSNSLLMTSNSAYSVLSSDYMNLETRLEGYNTADLGFGTANAKTITVSFWAYSSLTGNFGGALTNSARNRSYPFSYSIPTANTWTQISVTIAGDTTGTWATNNTRSFIVIFSLGAGSTYSGTAGAWAAATYTQPTSSVSVVGTNGATFYITGVQLEVGSSATGYEYRLYNQELSACQRYYQKIVWTDSTLTVGVTTSTSGVNGAPVYFPQEMRTTPTITLPTAGSSAGNATFLTATGAYPATFGSNVTEATRTTGFSIKGTGYTATFVSGNASAYYAAGTATIQISAEL
jgi:hypothetical protein